MGIFGIILLVGIFVVVYKVLFSGSGSTTVRGSGKGEKDRYSIDHRYNQERAARQKEIDRILDKISKRGLQSLTEEEKEFLDEHSRHS